MCSMFVVAYGKEYISLYHVCCFWTVSWTRFATVHFGNWYEVDFCAYFISFFSFFLFCFFMFFMFIFLLCVCAMIALVWSSFLWIWLRIRRECYRFWICSSFICLISWTVRSGCVSWIVCAKWMLSGGISGFNGGIKRYWRLGMRVACRLVEVLPPYGWLIVLYWWKSSCFLVCNWSHRQEKYLLDYGDVSFLVVATVWVLQMLEAVYLQSNKDVSEMHVLSWYHVDAYFWV